MEEGCTIEPMSQVSTGDIVGNNKSSERRVASGACLRMQAGRTPSELKSLQRLDAGGMEGG